MDTLSAAALARSLGTSTPRVTRAIRRLGIEAETETGRFQLTPAQVRKVRRELGVQPVAAGLTRSETLVLAGLRNAPSGLGSIRAVARRAGISATAAGRALERLRSTGLVRCEQTMIAAGRAQEVGLWKADLTNPRWSTLDPVLDRVERPRPPSARAKRVPRRLRHLFWNTAPEQLEVAESGPFIARRLLQTMDTQGLAWGADALSAADWRAGARARNLSEPVRQLAANLAAQAGR